ncbi:MAG: acyltransferase family protein [Bacteroidales bacterium]|nr:acyltransferase family protein [Bacteroidales bacterium]
MSKERLHYIDNIRILLTLFVIFIHIAMIYGAMSTWYYTEVKRPDAVTTGVLTIILLLGRSCGLGIFFALAGYMTALKIVEYKEKGKNYLASRLLRLGIPLMFFLLVIAPVTKKIVGLVVYHQSFNFIEVYRNYFNYFNGSQVGPLWFVELLIVFTLLYIFWFHVIRKGRPLALPEAFLQFPSAKNLLLFIVLLSAFTFAVRLQFREGYYFPPMNLEFANLPQYIIFFLFGTLLPQTRWQTKIPARTAKTWLVVALVNVFVVLPLIYTFVVLTKGNFDDYTGGLTWASFILTSWEIVNLVAINIAVFYYFRKSVNKQGRIARFFIPNLYVAYVVHPLVVILLALLVRNILLYPLLKITLVAPVGIFASFYVAHLLRSIPGVKKLLQEQGMW